MTVKTIPVEVILVGGKEIYALFEPFGFTGSWRADAYCDDPMKTFAELTGIHVDTFTEGRLIDSAELQEIPWAEKTVSDLTRLTDMYRLKEWLRLAEYYRVTLALI